MKATNENLTSAWPNHRPDYWAGQRGGRPLPKRAALPSLGDTGPAEPKLSLNMVFRTHDKAVEYARRFGKHVQIHVIRKYRDDGTEYRLFRVTPKAGRLVRIADKWGHKQYKPRRVE